MLDVNVGGWQSKVQREWKDVSVINWKRAKSSQKQTIQFVSSEQWGKNKIGLIIMTEKTRQKFDIYFQYNVQKW